MSDPSCEYAFDHEPGTTCPECLLEVDEWGNTEADFRNCSFPCCGCDGARLCMAPNGHSKSAAENNVEGMWLGNSREQRAARFKMLTGQYLTPEPEGGAA